MGNSNSSSSVQVGHHPIPSKWSSDHQHHSLQEHYSSSSSDARNRMKKSYFPPSHYLVDPRSSSSQNPHPHPLLVKPQHLVLPKKVNPKELRLKPTSNGVILHGGGTISGRKMNELELPTNNNVNPNLIRKKSSNSSSTFDDVNGNGRSTPNLSSLVETCNDDDEIEAQIHGNKHGKNGQVFSKVSKRREYESDPDFSRLSSFNSMMVDDDEEEDEDGQQESVDEEEEQIQPNSFTTSQTTISESPSQKQIRCRKKKSHAPMPPFNANNVNNNNNPTIIGDGIVIQSYTKSSDPQRTTALNAQNTTTHDVVNNKYMKKKLNRIFKTKDETKFNGENNNNNRKMNNNNNEICGKWEQLRDVKKGKGDDDDQYKYNDDDDDEQEQEQQRRNQNKHFNNASNKQQQLNSKNNNNNSKNNKEPDYEHDNHDDYDDDFCRKESSRTTILDMKNKKQTTTTTPLCSPSNNPSTSNSKSKESANVLLGGKSNKKESSSLLPSRHDLSSDASRQQQQQQVVSREVISGRASLPVNNTPESSMSSNNNSKLRQNQDVLDKKKQDKKKHMNNNDNNNNGNKILMENNHTTDNNKKTFYFGMEEDSKNTMRIKSHKGMILDNNTNNNNDMPSSSSSLTRSMNHSNNAALVKDKVIPAHNKNAKQSKNNKNLVDDEQIQVSIQSTSEQEAQKRKYIDGSSSTSHVKSERLGVGINKSQSSQGRNNNNHNNEQRDSNHDKNYNLNVHNNKMGQRSSTSSSTNKLQVNRSESDSDGIRDHNRQDSGNFDDFNESSRDRHEMKKQQKLHGIIHESLSSGDDLSSSEMDIPLLLRPTLPVKRHQLPRFSPASAWRAIDSPAAASGRSFSSEEFNHDDGGIQRYCTRPIAPNRNDHVGDDDGILHERSGDSGISAGDSPAIPDIIIPPPNILNQHQHTKDKINKCWTPQQDLDESSSEFDETELISNNIHNKFENNIPINITNDASNGRIINSVNGPRTPPKLTTKKHFFSKTSAILSNSNHNSDTEILNANPKKSLYSKSSRTMKQQNLSNLNEPTSFNEYYNDDDDNTNINSKPSLRRITNHHQRNNHFHRKSIGGENKRNEFSGLGSNWFLSRSEPNSLNNLRMMTIGQPLDFILHSRKDQHRHKRGVGDGNEDDDEYESETEQQQFGPCNSFGEVHSEFGYSNNNGGPTSLNNCYYYHSYSNHGRDVDGNGNDDEFGILHRPFSTQHIIYLPSYDSRKLYPSSSYHNINGSSNNNRRKTKSVDNLDSINVLYKPSITSSNHSNNYNNNRKMYPEEQLQQTRHNSTGSKNNTGINGVEMRKNYDKLSSNNDILAQPTNTNENFLVPTNLNPNNNFAEQYKRKKFKFQSTLRVLERKQIERQLAAEAAAKERERLAEIEAMKAVEEEFQKKRAKEKSDNELLVEKKKINEHDDGIVVIKPWESNSNHNQINNANINGNKNYRQPTSSSSKLNPIPVQHQIVRSPSPKLNYSKSNVVNGGTTVLSINNKQILNNKLSSNSSNSNSNSNSNSSNTSSSIGNGIEKNGKTRIISSVNINHHDQVNDGRQEPDGASSPSDLRRELIHASRKRNGTASSLSSCTDPLSTQELSEYRQETRQYWDYCRKSPSKNMNNQHHHRHHSSSALIPSNSSRHGDSSSDIYPASSKISHEKGGKGRFRSATTIIHPEVVCDIPAKSLHSSRLSGSTSNLLDDRSSLVGGSGPSSVISDNYRRDWAHKSSAGSIIHIVGPGSSAESGKRTSSIISLHSAPGYTSSTSDNFRHSNIDLSINNSNNTAATANHFSHNNMDNRHSALLTPKRKSPAFQKFGNDESSGPSSLVIAPSKSSRSSTNNNRHNNNMDHNNSMFQPQPFNNNKSKEYRPVVFKPSSMPSSTGAYHQMSSLS